MTTWGRRARGAIGMGLIWAAAWFAAGVVVARFPGVHSDLPPALMFAPLGFLCGVMFSLLLVANANRRRFDRMSLPKFAAWGAASGLLFTAIPVVGAALRGASVATEFLTFGPALAMASAVCAAGSVAMARRAERRELRSAGDQVFDAAITEGATRGLPRGD